MGKSCSFLFPDMITHQTTDIYFLFVNLTVYCIGLPTELQASNLTAEQIIQVAAFTETPFVNREREVVELALYNANYVFLLKNQDILTDKRPLKFIYAAQMYGAGKTRLGSEFISQLKILKDTTFKKYCPNFLSPHIEDLMKIIVEHHAAIRVIFDATGAASFKALERMLGGSLKQLMCDICDVARQPVFFHFDEIGGMEADGIRELRLSCFHTSLELKSQNCFPFFFLSGRGAACDELGTANSPMGSHWIILEPLQRCHVQEMIRRSTPRFKFHIDLTDEEFDNLADTLIIWTAGAPRPLIYTMHMLNALHACHGQYYKSKEGLKKVFKELVAFISSNILVNELGVPSLNVEQKKVYDFFFFCFFTEKCIDTNMKLLWLADKTVDVYLRSFNIFANINEDGKVHLIAPEFVRCIVHKESVSSWTNTLKFFQSYMHPPKYFEFVIPQMANVWLCISDWMCEKPLLFPYIIPDNVLQSTNIHKLNIWEKRGPVIQNTGQLSRDSIASIVRRRSIEESCRLSRKDFGYFCDQLQVGDLVVTGQKSSAADVIVKAGEKFVIEIQIKTGEQLSLRDVETEVNKSVVRDSPDFESIFIVLIANGIKYEHNSDTSYGITNVNVFIPTTNEIKNFFHDDELFSEFKRKSIM